ncbi:FGGY-family carbohydrate kinase, partial [bacterium]|nr:FGGY-family carbohydrate kinase [bacterium]
IRADMAAAGMDVPPHLRVDGGMVANDWLCQNLADICDCPIDRPEVTETTALGAAMLAMLHLGWFESLQDLASHWALQKHFEPSMSADQRAVKKLAWQLALQRVLQEDNAHIA